LAFSRSAAALNAARPLIVRYEGFEVDRFQRIALRAAVAAKSSTTPPYWASPAPRCYGPRRRADRNESRLHSDAEEYLKTKLNVNVA
jgi:hypothetical protein